MKIRFAPFMILSLPLLVTACAAPIKALMQPHKAEAETASMAGNAVTAPESSALKAALEKKAAAMRSEWRERPPAPLVGAKARPVTKPISPERPVRAAESRLPDTRLDQPQSSNRVHDMLARLRTMPDQSTSPSARPTAQAETMRAFAPVFHVKAESRLGDDAAGMENAPGIHFAERSVELDAPGNRVLAGVIARAINPAGYRLIVTAGLAGSGQPWEKMHLAAARIEAVANHVAPPLEIVKRFDPALAASDVRLELLPVSR